MENNKVEETLNLIELVKIVPELTTAINFLANECKNINTNFERIDKEINSIKSMIGVLKVNSEKLEFSNNQEKEKLDNIQSQTDGLKESIKKINDNLELIIKNNNDQIKEENKNKENGYKKINQNVFAKQQSKNKKK